MLRGLRRLRRLRRCKNRGRRRRGGEDELLRAHASLVAHT
jgi:hypothetical protein